MSASPESLEQRQKDREAIHGVDPLRPTEKELLRCEDCAPEFPCWEYVHSRCRKRAHELGAGPDYLKEAFRYLCRELERKQGMIDDLHAIANANFGMTPEDCVLLTQSVRDRDNLKAATEAIACVFY